MSWHFFSGWIETAWGRGHMMNEPSLSSPPSLFPQVSFWPRFEFTWRLMKLFFGLVQTKIYWNVQQFWFVVGFDKVGWLAMYMNAALWFIESRWRGDQWITNIWNLTNAFFMADFSFFLISFHKGEILIHRKGYLSYRGLDVLKALVKGMDMNFHSHWLCFLFFHCFIKVWIWFVHCNGCEIPISWNSINFDGKFSLFMMKFTWLKTRRGMQGLRWLCMVNVELVYFIQWPQLKLLIDFFLWNHEISSSTTP